MKYILYTEDQVGKFHVFVKSTDKETVEFFHEIRDKRRFEFRTGDKTVKVLPSYIALVETEDDYDFVLDGSRVHPRETEILINEEI